ncbi:MAG: sigma-70 family RNA polymerase sigma factor [Propionibacteriaceae bacterium]
MTATPAVELHRADVRTGAIDEAEDEREARTRELFTRARDADVDQRKLLHTQIVELHLDVPSAIARRYRYRGVDEEDLLQVARLGLLQAVARYRLERGPFLAYARPTMVGAVKRHFRDCAWVVRPPRGTQEAHAAVMGVQDELTQRLRRAPSIAELAAALNVSEVEIRRTHRLQGCFHPASLDLPEERVLASNQALMVHDEADLDRIDAALSIRTLCAELSELEQRMIALHFFRGYSQAQVGAELGLTQMQVSRQLRRTLTFLRALFDQTAPAGT